MNLREWEDRYRGGDFSTQPAPLVRQWSGLLRPGKALDLACGAGRNSVFLAEGGWHVTAVDGSAAAIEIVKSRSSAVTAVIADLETHEFKIQPDCWNLILICCYFQRDLFPAIRAGLRMGGLVIAVAHVPERAAPGELQGFFDGWEVFHQYEGPSRDPYHRRVVAEIVARKPGGGPS